MTRANLDSSIALRSSEEMAFPLSRLLSSLKVTIPFRANASYRWSTKFKRVSSPLKLRKTSYFHRGGGGEEEVEAEAEGIDDILIKLLKVSLEEEEEEEEEREWNSYYCNSYICLPSSVRKQFIVSSMYNSSKFECRQINFHHMRWIQLDTTWRE